MRYHAACQTVSQEPTRRFAPLVVILAALAMGILADSRWALPLWAWLAASGVALVGWMFFWLRGRTRVSAWILMLAVACRRRCPASRPLEPVPGGRTRAGRG